MVAVIHQPGEGEVLDVGGSKTAIKAGGKETDGAFTLAETTMPPGFPGPPPHYHEQMYDSFFVLEGTLTLLLGDEEREVGAGGYAYVPPGTLHTFSNRSDSDVRMRNLSAPGGLDEYLRELSEALGSDDFDPSVIPEIAARHDVHLPSE